LAGAEGNGSRFPFHVYLIAAIGNWSTNPAMALRIC
jgi:hypothetical protein